ncbi:MAG: SWIM zinc finger family protein [Aggregatilineales bacterium]
MDYGMISQIEKGRQYAQEPHRIKFNTLALTFKGDNATYTITLDDSGWHCSCPGFQTYRICPHIMALERILKPMLKVAPLPYAPGQNVVSDVEKAHRYAQERDRIRFTAFNATVHGNNSEHTVTYDNGVWYSDSTSFKLRGVSSHIIALERLLKGMVEPAQATAALPLD